MGDAPYASARLFSTEYCDSYMNTSQQEHTNGHTITKIANTAEQTTECSTQYRLVSGVWLWGLTDCMGHGTLHTTIHIRSVMCVRAVLSAEACWHERR